MIGVILLWYFRVCVSRILCTCPVQSGLEALTDFRTNFRQILSRSITKEILKILRNVHLPPFNNCQRPAVVGNGKDKLDRLRIGTVILSSLGKDKFASQNWNILFRILAALRYYLVFMTTAALFHELFRFYTAINPWNRIVQSAVVRRKLKDTLLDPVTAPNWPLFRYHIINSEWFFHRQTTSPSRLSFKMAKAVEPMANISAPDLLNTVPRLFGWVRKEDNTGLRAVVKPLLDCMYCIVCTFTNTPKTEFI